MGEFLHYQSAAQGPAVRQTVLYPAMIAAFTFYSYERSIDRIKECESLFFSRHFIENPLLNANINLIFEILRRFMQFGDKHERAYEMTVKFLRMVDGKRVNHDLIVAYLLKLSYFIGFGIEFDQCRRCKRTIVKDEKPVDDPLFFSYAEGGLVCGECRFFLDDSRRMNTLPLSGRAADYMRRLLFSPFFTDEARLPLNEKKAVRDQLIDFYQYHSGAALKTVAFLKEMDR